MNLEEAVQAHGQWKVKLRTAISKHETLDAATISADNCCTLGKWLYGEGKTQYATLPSFGDVVKKHAEFHKEAGKVASAINAKKFTEAESMLESGTPYANTSSAVGVALMHLKKEAKL